MVIKNKIEKGRDWSFVVYPESAPSNWRDILDDTHIKWIESPLHDKDVNADGEVKKSHWHILVSFEGPVTSKPVNDITRLLNSPIPQKVASSKGLVRYMAHLDNPEKYQYSISDIVGHGGADVASYFELSASNRLGVLKEMIVYIFANNVDNYADFLMFCIESAPSDDWFDIAVNHNTLAINKMLDAMWHRNQK